MSGAYYNEIDPYAAEWLRNLILFGHIAPGDVDTRSIEDVSPDDLRPYTQCHFFAGIGVWSHALRSAGWSDDTPVWTGSCPCQPFSSAGQGAGFDDERHLWPAFYHLIEERRPAIVLGEQVASKDADPWIDLVQADVEAVGYAFGAVPFPSASVGAPHIRDRLYWVANADDARLEGWGQPGRERATECAAGPSGLAGRLGHSDGERAGRNGRSVRGALTGFDGQHGADDAYAPGGAGGVEHAESCGREGQPIRAGASGPTLRDAQGSDFGGVADTKRLIRRCEAESASYERAQEHRPADRTGGCGSTPAAGAGPTNGFWADADWLFCRDGKWRPVEPSTFPLAHGAPARVGRLRAYGNAINAKAAQAFIECVMGR